MEELERLKQENKTLNDKYYFLKEKSELQEQNKELKNKIKQIRYKKINETIRGLKKWLK